MDLWNVALPAQISARLLADIMADIMKTSLSEHEQSAESGAAVTLPAGHTLRKHVAKSDAELRARLVWDRYARASSGFYHDSAFAETIIAKAMLSHLADVYHWYIGDKSATACPADEWDNDKDLTILYTNNFPVGRTFRKRHPCAPPVEKNRVKILLRWIEEQETSLNSRRHFVLTAYPC
ncbi:RNase A-like domain-containing protein [Erwinia sp. V71]|uniref:RNase A-like domain-containing protein n=1 Tax=Erwinia sp. V71 TaxID=3369424 RepID=UPI003F5E5DAB